MGCHILRGVINGDSPVEYFYCSVTDSILTEPQMGSGEAGPFREWLGRDPRGQGDLDRFYESWRRAGRPGFPWPEASDPPHVGTDGEVVELFQFGPCGDGRCLSPAEARSLAAQLNAAADEAAAYQARLDAPVL